MSQAILVASFGTTHADTCTRNIASVEEAVTRAFPESTIYRAFTSGIVKRILDARGNPVDNADEALARIEADGHRDLFVLPTHLLYGVEYDDLVAQVRAHAGRFDSVRIAAPLLADVSDYRIVLQTLFDSNPLQEYEALVLMGHGTSHACNPVYAALDYEAKAMGLSRIFVGTVEAYPALDDTIVQVLKAGFKRALITPLMLVAGDHAVNDMAADEPGSWKTSFAEAGILPRCLVKGLGEYPAVRDLYCAHAADAAPLANAPADAAPSDKAASASQIEPRA